MTSPWPYNRAVLVKQARQSIRKGSKSFATASRLFDRTTRERVWMLYAWCRACDDIADDQDHGHAMGQGGSTLDAASRIATIRALTELAVARQPTGAPAFDALGQLLSEVPIPCEMLEDVIAGFELDTRDWRPRSEADMLRYCYHVAGAVGVLMAAVMGVSLDESDERAADTLDRACDLGLAFQLSNIVRDVWEDDANARCYLPVEWLVEADLPPGEHTKPHYRDRLVPIVAKACDLARGYEASSRVGAMRLPFRQRWAILSAASIYGAIGQRVKELGPHAWDHRVVISKAEKARFLLNAFAQARSGMASEAQRPALSRRELARLARSAD